MSKKNRSILIGVAILLVLVIAALAVYIGTRPQAQAGQKTITVEVVHKDESRKEFRITTSAENLRGALEQEKLVQGSESEYGLFIETVDGETADSANQEWWAVTKNGTMAETGVEGIMIADGEHYELTLTVGW